MEQIFILEVLRFYKLADKVLEVTRSYNFALLKKKAKSERKIERKLDKLFLKGEYFHAFFNNKCHHCFILEFDKNVIKTINSYLRDIKVKSSPAPNYTGLKTPETKELEQGLREIHLRLTSLKKDSEISWKVDMLVEFIYDMALDLENLINGLTKTGYKKSYSLRPIAFAMHYLKKDARHCIQFANKYTSTKNADSLKTRLSEFRNPSDRQHSNARESGAKIAITSKVWADVKEILDNERAPEESYKMLEDEKAVYYKGLD